MPNFEELGFEVCPSICFETSIFEHLWPPFNEDILGKIGNVSNSNWLHVDSVFFGFLYQFKVCSIDSSIMIDDKPEGLDLNSYCSNSWGQPLISGWISGS